MTREARLGRNGPEVIEQESGIDESMRVIERSSGPSTAASSVTRPASPMPLVDDDIHEVGAAIRKFIGEGRSNCAQNFRK